MFADALGKTTDFYANRGKRNIPLLEASKAVLKVISTEEKTPQQKLILAEETYSKQLEGEA